jgi:pyruvate dehydrogenase E2 component (dihydrolipoamide acetyltransferase)
MADFRMPSLGADMEAGTLVRWLKHPGDTVARGDIIAIVDTQKGAIEVEVFEDGVVAETLVEPGTEVPVGTVLARITRPGEPSPPVAPLATSVPVPPPPAETSHAAPSPAAAPPVPAPQAAPPAASGGPSARVMASPAARALATQLHVDLAAIRGTGPEGAVTRDDVQRAAASPAQPAAATAGGGPATAAPAPPPGDRSAAMRAAIGAAMARSKREIPHYYLSTTIDLTSALRWMRRENERRPVTERLLPAALLLKAVALALREVPELNGYWIDGGFRGSSAVHLGVAISLRGGGLVAPAIHDADRLDLTALMRSLHDVVGRARTGSLRSSELSDSTITVTNLGDQGVEAAFGIIYPPQVAIVGFGTIAWRPWAVPSGQVEAREAVTATLSGDHRATDGHRGGLFLAALNRLLQAPEQL